MKKILFLLAIATLIGCSKNVPEEVKLLKEITVVHSKADSVYQNYGCYKEVFRVYNRSYEDSMFCAVDIDSMSYVGCYINEYGDTIIKRYTDTSNYPRREE